MMKQTPREAFFMRLHPYKGEPPLRRGNIKEFERSQGMKRTDYISWDQYFMGIAMMSAERSKDPSTQVGACIVDKNNCVGVLVKGDINPEDLGAIVDMMGD